MILCAKCNTWQHGICYKITKEEDAPETHICDKCADVSISVLFVLYFVCLKKIADKLASIRVYIHYYIFII